MHCRNMFIHIPFVSKAFVTIDFHVHINSICKNEAEGPYLHQPAKNVDCRLQMSHLKDFSVHVLIKHVFSYGN